MEPFELHEYQPDVSFDGGDSGLRRGSLAPHPQEY